MQYKCKEVDLAINPCSPPESSVWLSLSWTWVDALRLLFRKKDTCKVSDGCVKGRDRLYRGLWWK